MPEPDTTPALCGCGNHGCEICNPIRHDLTGGTAADNAHICKPGASLYYCPTAGETESDCHGGFDVCCDRPDLHQPLVTCSWAAVKRPHDGHSWEPQPDAPLVYCEGISGRTETGATITNPQVEGGGAGDTADTHRRLLAVSRTARTEKRRRHDTEDILRDLIDPDPCWYDHHGYCQAHSWLTTEPACPHARAKALLTPPAPGGHDGEGQ